jgi:hypothetical protein
MYEVEEAKERLKQLKAGGRPKDDSDENDTMEVLININGIPVKKIIKTKDYHIWEPVIMKPKNTGDDGGDIDSGYMLSDFVEKLRDSRILTTDGWKTMGQMMKARKKLTVIIYDRQDIARCVRDKIPDGKVYAFLTPDRTFELFVCMKYAGKDIEVLDGENELCDIRDREYRWIHWRPEPEDSIRSMSVLHVANSGQPDYIVKMFRAYAAVTDYGATKSNEEVTAMRDAILGPEKAAH